MDTSAKKLYIVRTRSQYLFGENKSVVRPLLLEIVVVKETAQNYLVTGAEATGYHSRVSKVDVNYANSPADAWDIFISRAQQLILNLKGRVTEQTAAVSYAKAMRRNCK